MIQYSQVENQNQVHNSLVKEFHLQINNQSQSQNQINHIQFSIDQQQPYNFQDTQLVSNNQLENLQSLLNNLQEETNHSQINQKSEHLIQKDKIDYEKNKKQILELVQKYKKQKGIDHSQTIQKINQLCQLYYKDGQLSQAQALVKQVQFIYQTYNKKLDELLIYARANKVYILFSQQIFQEALDLALENIKIWKKNQLPSQNKFYVSLFNLTGVLYVKLSNFQKAQYYYTQAIVFWQKLKNTENFKDTFHQQMAMEHTNLMQVQYQLGKMKQANENMEKAEQYMNLLKQFNNQVIANFYMKKGKLLLLQEDYINCLTSLIKSQKIFKQLLKQENHSRKVQISFQIGCAYLLIAGQSQFENQKQDKGQNKEAQSCFKECLQMTKNRVGVNDIAYKNLKQKIIQIKQKVQEYFSKDSSQESLMNIRDLSNHMRLNSLIRRDSNFQRNRPQNQSTFVQEDFQSLSNQDTYIQLSASSIITQQ